MRKASICRASSEVAIRHLRAGDRRAVPWKNGGGVTHEIAAFPPGARLDTFDWRISMATVERAGPFSTFEGVDRTLTLLVGSLSLQYPEAELVALDERSDPFSFDGGTACFGAPSRVVATDLNVMVRRGWAKAHVRRLSGPASIPCVGTALCVFTLDPVVLNGTPLGPFDAVLVEAGGTINIGDVGCRLIVVDLVWKTD